MPELQSQTGRHFSFIDHVRGLAALAVAFFHMYLSYLPASSVSADAPALSTTPAHSLFDSLIYGYFDLGKFAVILFFMVSGYLIPASIRQLNDPKSFAIHRFFRLFPAYWLSIIAALSLATWVPLPEPRPATLTRIVANLTMLQGYLHQKDLIGLFWTLQIEITFYALVLILFFLNRLNHSRLLVSGSLIAGLAVAIVRYRTGIHLPLVAFNALALMFFADYLRREQPPLKRFLLPAALLLAALLLLCQIGYWDEKIRYSTSYAFGLLIFLALYTCRAHIRTHAISKFLADISYSVYLFHPLTGLVLVQHLIPRGLPRLVTISLGLLLTVAVATPIYYLLERPCIALGKHWTGARRNPTPSPSIVPRQ